MRSYVLLLCTATIVVSFSSSSSVLSQESDIEEKIKKSGFDATAKLLQLLYQKNNVLFSPFNVRLALAALHLGAFGTTRDELANFLGLPKNASEIQQAHETFGRLLKNIEDTSDQKLFSTDIKIANGLFVQNNTIISRQYTSPLKSYYKFKVANVEFNENPSKATNEVNRFISDGTKGRIPKLFASSLDRDTRILLAATLYFKASWKNPFQASTAKETFDTGSSNASVELMQRDSNVPYINLPDLQVEAIGLPYMSDASMFFVLPYVNQTLDVVISALNGNILRKIAENSESEEVSYKIPRTKYKWSENLNNPLQRLDINQLFSDQAKFSFMHSKEGLRVSRVTHAAEIEINESGTDASAVTAIEIGVRSGFTPDPTITFHVNRPFLFFIYHHATQTILFIGAVHDPTGL